MIAAEPIAQTNVPERNRSSMPERSGSSVRVLAPWGIDWPESLGRVADTSLDSPFAEARCSTLANLASVIRNDSQLRSDAASIALAYWLRPSNLRQLSDRFRRRLGEDDEFVPVPVGRVFHIAPANVDTLFVYSWALSFVCGNANVVRVSAQQSPVVERLLVCINQLMKVDCALRDSNLFVTYDHNDAITAAISQACDHRVLWGGDGTVQAIRPLPLSPHSSERTFGSKFSYAILHMPSVKAASDAELAKLSEGFFNDMFSFDQMACSSPQVVFWVGIDPEGTAISRFERSLEEEIRRRHYSPPLSEAVRRLQFAFEVAADVNLQGDFSHSGFVRLRIDNPDQMTKDTCGGGLLRYVQVESLADIAKFATANDQTITHWGFSADELKAFAFQVGRRGVDRIVPVGHGLSFSAIWDGYDLLNDFIRRIVVQV